MKKTAVEMAVSADTMQNYNYRLHEITKL